MKQNKIIFFLIILAGFTSCTQTKYWVKSEQDLSNINIEQSALNFIPLSTEDIEKSALLDTTYKLIASKKYSKLNRYLSSVKSKTPDFYLAKTLYYISKNDYEKAATNLNLIDENNYMLQKDLLFVDLSYEFAKRNGVTYFTTILQDYQTILDKYPDNEFLKKIIAIRIRYVRYKY